MNSDNDNFSFRWGVALFDNKHTKIPNAILEHYHRVPWQSVDPDTGEVLSGEGITNTEMMFVIHLASFKYETAKGKAMPSLTGSLKERMNYKSNQGIINIEQGLIDKGLLLVNKSRGRKSEYDFTPFSKAILSLLDINQSTKVDDLGERDEIEQSTKVDDLVNIKQSTEVDTSRKVDGTGQEKLTRRRKEEDLNTNKEDYLDTVTAVAQQEKPEMAPEPSPFDKHFGGYRDEAVSEYCKTFRTNLERGKREEIIDWYQDKLKQDGNFDMDCWRRSCKSCYLGNVRAGNLSAVFDTYDEGGDYRSLFRRNTPKAQAQTTPTQFPTQTQAFEPETIQLTAEELTWNDALTRLKFSMSDSVFQQWFVDTMALPRTNGIFRVGTHSKAGQQWLSTQLMPNIKRALSSCDNSIDSVEIIEIEVI